ncbi:hypothetical protein HEK616_27200 [Streptomyces nigrescens]|uniref:Integral membrane protein n=2 Tax=Streptomyces TaxID=1883 RepID=A0ABM7ZS86_STRNI|nr:hypothetical protein [Streptomyces nigrescens]MEE4418411.1 hypothetical protein [Streptomyces sp. DSM 41528]BDM69233.1 hypothetical protein HEK616_27200 [Streptomyces nigrescens]
MTPLAAPSRPSYLRVVRASAWYDLVVTAGFATPWTYTLVHGALSSWGAALGLGAMPAREPMQTLFANLMGSVVVVWALLRVVRPLPVHGLYDAAARTLFASWQAYALVHGAPRVLWPFFLVEVAFGVVQLVPWWRNRRALPAPERRPRSAHPRELSGPTDGR